MQGFLEKPGLCFFLGQRAEDYILADAGHVELAGPKAGESKDGLLPFS